MPWNSVAKIQVTVTLASGDIHTLTVDQPKPTGSNPRFIGQQIDSALVEVADRLWLIAGVYGDQIGGSGAEQAS